MSILKSTKTENWNYKQNLNFVHIYVCYVCLYAEYSLNKTSHILKTQIIIYFIINFYKLKINLNSILLLYYVGGVYFHFKLEKYCYQFWTN